MGRHKRDILSAEGGRKHNLDWASYLYVDGEDRKQSVLTREHVKDCLKTRFNCFIIAFEDRPTCRHKQGVLGHVKTPMGPELLDKIR